MSDEVRKELDDKLQKMPPMERQALLRAVLRVRFFCPRCPVKSRGFHLDPCYSCIVLPRACGRPMTTVN
jgi:hypothetical protein